MVRRCRFSQDFVEMSPCSSARWLAHHIGNACQAVEWSHHERRLHREPTRWAFWAGEGFDQITCSLTLSGILVFGCLQ